MELTLSYEAFLGILQDGRSLQVKLACMNLLDKMPIRSPCTKSIQPVGSNIVHMCWLLLLSDTYCRYLRRRCGLNGNVGVTGMMRDAPVPGQEVSTCKRCSASARVRLFSSI
jgi:hypothetical protein